MAYRRGIDVSHWEPNIKWAEVAATGVEFSFMKASQGTVPDECFAEFWKNSRGLVDRGPYAFYDPRYVSITPKIQAQFFWDTIKNEPGELPPVVDIEEYKTGPYHGATYWYDFIQYFNDLSGKYPIIYTAYYYWTDNVRIKPVSDVSWFARNCDLWIANYTGGEPLVPEPWRSRQGWLYWQYSSTGTVPGVYNERGQLTACDLDYFKGASDVPPEENGMLTGKVTVSLNIRSSPRVESGNIIGALKVNDIVEADMRSGDWWHLTKIIRNNTVVPLPAPNSYASQGPNPDNRFIEEITPPAGEDFIIHHLNGEQHRYDRS